MNKASIKKFALLMAVILIPGTLLWLLSTAKHNFTPKPYLGSYEVVENNINGVIQRDTLYYTVPFFSISDENGKQIDSAFYSDKILAIEFYRDKPKFKRPYFNFDAQEDICFLSLTLNPDVNNSHSVEYFKDEINFKEGVSWAFGVDDVEKLLQLGFRDWFNGSQLSNIDSLRLMLENNDLMLILDKSRRVRGVYNSTVSSNEITRLIEDIRMVKKQEDHEEKYGKPEPESSHLSYRDLPYYGPKTVFMDSLDGLWVDTLYHVVPYFSFENQNGDTIDQETFDDKVYVADYFFTTCGTICPKMSSEMKRVQDYFKGNKELMFLSHTVNPEYDSAEVLGDYAAELEADLSNWHFVTGEKEDLYEQGELGYFMNTGVDLSSPDGFMHSELFMLVDKEKHIRGMYDGTDSLEVERLIEDIQLLFYNQ